MVNEMMIDLETLSLNDNAVIASYGWTVFNQEEGMLWTGGRTVNVTDCLIRGAHIDGDTVQWWRSQSGEAKADLMEAPIVGVEDMLDDISSNWDDHGCEKVWSHGSSFDIQILKWYFAQLGTPWTYKQIRDTRTLYDFEEAEYQRRETSITHSAKGDAIHQTERLLAVRKWIKT